MMMPIVMSATQRYSRTLYCFLANSAPNNITGIICVVETRQQEEAEATPSAFVLRQRQSVEIIADVNAYSPLVVPNLKAN